MLRYQYFNKDVKQMWPSLSGVTQICFQVFVGHTIPLSTKALTWDFRGPAIPRPFKEMCLFGAVQMKLCKTSTDEQVLILLNEKQ